MPVPQALLDTVGQTHKFLMKVSEHNLEGKTQTIIVTKILPREAPPPLGHLEEDAVTATCDDNLKTGCEEPGPSRGFEVLQVIGLERHLSVLNQMRPSVTRVANNSINLSSYAAIVFAAFSTFAMFLS